MFKKFNQRILFHSALIVLVSLAGIAYAVDLGFYIHKTNKQALIMRANTIAQFITANEVEALSGSDKDLDNPVYLQIKTRLMSLREVNPDTRFIYLNGSKNGKIFFYADSEDSQSEDYSPPGQQYEEASKLVRELFVKKTSGFEIASDRWGIWASAMVPIIDPVTGKMVALLGMDIPAYAYIYNITAYGLLALLFAAFMVFLLMNQQRTIKNMRMAQESLEANNFELMHMNAVLSERELKLATLEKEIKAIKNNAPTKLKNI